MKKAIGLALLLWAAPIIAQADASASLPGWMAGAWEQNDGSSWADEFWSPSRGGMMIGSARTGFGPELQTWEHTRIERKADGRLSFYAMPKGAKPTEFPMVLQTEDSIEFANAAHDFPQRIRYWREGNLLMAEISKMDGSDKMRWNFRPMGQ